MVKARLVIALALGLLAPTAAAHAQAPVRIPRICVLSDESPSSGPIVSREPLEKGLHELGYTKGQNLAIEYRYDEGKHDRLPTLAAELVALKPDVIVAIGTPAALTAKGATK